MEEQSKESLLKKIKQELDDLEVQLNLGSKELKEAYENRKTRFSEMVKRIQDYLDESEKTGKEKIEELKKSSKELLDTLENDYDFSYTDYSEKSNDIKNALLNFEKSVKEYYDKSGLEAKKNQFEQELKQGIEKFKTELSVHQTQLKQLQENSNTEWEEWKKARLEDVEEMKQKLDQKLGGSKEKIDQFNKEISEAYQHLKSAFKKFY